MNVVDSSGWLEYLADGPNADFFAKPIITTADLVVPTLSGRSARLISAHRPTVPIYALSPGRETVRRCGLMWGVQAASIKRIEIRFQRRERRAERDYVDWVLLGVSALLRDSVAVEVGGGIEVLLNPDLAGESGGPRHGGRRGGARRPRRRHQSEHPPGSRARVPSPRRRCRVRSVGGLQQWCWHHWRILAAVGRLR